MIKGISKLTLCITNINKMVKFYQNVFDIEFSEIEAYDTLLYSGKFLGLDILFCPNDIAQVDAQQNRHQFDFIVDDIELVVEKCLSSYGKLIGKIETNLADNEKIASIIDPDDNTIVLVEKLESVQ